MSNSEANLLICALFFSLCLIRDCDDVFFLNFDASFSGRIPCPYPGRIWLEQRGLQRALYWHIEARVVLDLRELVISVLTFNSNICFSTFRCS